ncbi:MAG: hypothetical protein QXT64_03190 [Desulfurococcaceae archaeon]
MEAKEIVEALTYKTNTKWFRGTNTGEGAAYFSLTRKKFIKPRAHWGARTEFYYTLFPGRYLYLSWSYWNKQDPPHVIIVSLVEVKEKDGKLVEENKKAAMWRISRNYAFINPILQDFFAARPGYHGWPHLSFDKVYSESDVAELLQYIENDYEFTEGEEHE